MFKKLLLSAINIFLFYQVFSQLSINTAGGNAKSLTGEVSYSIGQVDYSNFKTNVGSINQGVQQPLIWFLKSGLIELDIVKQNEKLQLQWKMSEFVNGDYFEVQTSNEPNNFITVGKVPYRNINHLVLTNYSFTINPGLQGITFYRIKLIFKDGSYSISKIQMLDFGTNANIKTYPNPVIDNLIVEIKDNPLKNGQLKLWDNNGKLLLSKKITQLKTTIELSDLPSAGYFLEFMDENNHKQVYSIIKK